MAARASIQPPPPGRECQPSHFPQLPTWHPNTFTMNELHQESRPSARSRHPAQAPLPLPPDLQPTAALDNQRLATRLSLTHSLPKGIGDTCGSAISNTHNGVPDPLTAERHWRQPEPR